MLALLVVWRILMDYGIAPRVMGHELEIHLCSQFSLSWWAAQSAESWGSIFPCLSSPPCGSSTKGSHRLRSVQQSRTILLTVRNQEERPPRWPDGRVETEMIMQRVAPVPNASHELIGTSLVYRDTARAAIPETERVSLARFAWLVVAYNVAVIVWGAYVRASGSGAGCGSHWPLCNGEFLPTTPQTQTVIEFTHRVTSGVSLVLVAMLLIWCWRRTQKEAGRVTRLLPQRCSCSMKL